MSTPTPGGQQVSRPLLILLGVVALLAVGYLLLTVLTGSGDEVAAVGPTEGPLTSSEPVVDPLDPEAPVEAGSEIGDVEPTFEVFDARDPFEQLIAADTNVGEIGTTQPASDTTTDPTGTTDPTDPTGTTTDPAVDDPTQTGATDPSQTTVGGTTIMLEDVYSSGGEDVAVVVVDAEGYEAREGETVAGKVDVLDIAGSCATMRYNDNRFILCEGEQIRK